MKGSRKQHSFAKRCRFPVEYAIVRFLEIVIPLFPRRWIQATGRALATAAYGCSKTIRTVSRQNLDVAFGDSLAPAEKERIARLSLQTATSTVLTLFWAPRLTQAEFDRLVVLDESSRTLLQTLKARGKGVIAFTLHYGDWETLGLGTGYLAGTTTIVQEARANAALESIFARLRGVTGNRILPNRFVGMTLVKTLKRGGMIALLIDLNASRRRGGQWLNWFGLPAFCTTAVGELAVHTGAAIMAGHAEPLPDGRVRLVYGPEISYSPGGSAAAINQRCLAYCEQLIRARPELWLWSYKRWSLRPTPEPGRYPAYSRYNPKMELVK
jgi:KDO2-lipid IV(A) lauroyltransferase